MRKNISLPPHTVDFHSHILPGVDHGSRDLAMASAQWELLRRAGLSAVVATPHFYAHEEASVKAFLARRDAAAASLLSAVPEGGPRLYLGAEVLVCRGLEELPDLRELCIAGTDVMMLEMPLGGWSREHLDTVACIAERGIVPLLAHIDRYPLRNLDALYGNDRFLYQVNVTSLMGLGRVARYFRRMLRAGAIAALGSDLHGLPQDGYGRYLRAFGRAGEALSEVNAHTSELLSTAVPFA